MKAPQSRRRSRSNDGTPNHVSRVLPIDPRLLASLLAEFGPDRVVRREPRIFHGPKAFHGGAPAPVLSDEQVLALRKMRDWHGMTFRAIAQATGLGEMQVQGICEYKTRVHLDPGPRPAPAEQRA